MSLTLEIPTSSRFGDSSTHSPPSSASSLSSSLDAVSVDSHSTAASSLDFRPCPIQLKSPSLPSAEAFVLVPSQNPDPRILQSIHSQYAPQGILGVYLPRLPEFDLPDAHNLWSTEIHNAHEVFILSASNNVAFQTQHHFFLNKPEVSSPEHHLAISSASLRSIISFPSADERWIFYLLERPTVVFPPLSATAGFSQERGVISRGNIPTLKEWETLWSAWDLITLKMIPQEMLHQKPIELRHKPLFYIGHIPTFLDMLLSKSMGGGASEPQYFWNIFERGIDPHVDDPDHCHNHSEVPEADEDWPTIDTIVAFRNRVRARLVKLYHELESGQRVLTRNIARTLVMTLEHEGFHIETLLYILIQRAGFGTLPPPGFVAPPWDALASQWDAIPPPSTPRVTLGPATLTLGHDDSEALDDTDAFSTDVNNHTFGWDNESPRREVTVGAFQSEWRPVTNGEFESFWRGAGQRQVSMPKTWVEDDDGQVKVRTMYGPVSMNIAQHWPVLTSYDDLETYARFKGGRLPTEHELRLFLDTYDVGHEGGANIGFRNWHPAGATSGLEENHGKGTNGGVWEWTSTKFDTHEGLSPTNLFTGYSTDFFDDKHHVVLGASYATIPRLASRRTVRNFYQHNYPYPWVGARVVYDM